MLNFAPCCFIKKHIQACIVWFPYQTEMLKKLWLWYPAIYSHFILFLTMNLCFNLGSKQNRSSWCWTWPRRTGNWRGILKAAPYLRLLLYILCRHLLSFLLEVTSFVLRTTNPSLSLLFPDNWFGLQWCNSVFSKG